MTEQVFCLEGRGVLVNNASIYVVDIDSMAEDLVFTLTSSPQIGGYLTAGCAMCTNWGGEWPSGLERRTGDCGFLGEITSSVRILLAEFRFGTLIIPFTRLCQCLLEETLKDVGPFYPVSMPGEVKDPTQSRGLHHS